MTKISAKKIKKYFDDLDEPIKTLAYRTVDDYIDALAEMDRLKPLPKILVSKSDRTIQKTTPAAKLYKETSQIADAKCQILIRMLKKNDTSAADELNEMLKEYL